MTNDYDIPALGPESFSTISDLTEQFAATGASEKWGVYQAQDDGGPLSIVGTWIERTVFRELYGTTETDVAEEYSPFIDRSVWTVIVHHPSNRAVGATRCLVGPARQLMAAIDLAAIWNMSWDEGCDVIGADPDGRFIEAASFSVLPEWRSADKMWPVKVACSTYMHMFEDVQADWAVQIINPSVKRLFESWGTPFVSMAQPRDFSGVTFEPAVIPQIPGRPFFKTRDAEYYELMQNRNGSGRGGTLLPVIDLDRPSAAIELDNELRAKQTDHADTNGASGTFA